MTSLGLLTKSQSVFVDKMSQIIIRESTDLKDTSSDDELTQMYLRDDMDKHARKMVWSKADSDKRLLNIYRVREAGLNDDKIGLNGFE